MVHRCTGVQVMDQEVYRMLEARAGLERVSVGPGSPQSFVFCSPDLDTKTEVVVLIHGSGVVRAGQWARRLIINEVSRQCRHCRQCYHDHR